MDKIKILMVLGNTGRGGSQAYVMNVVRSIDRERFQIDFVYSDDEAGGYGDEMRSLGCKTYLLPFFKGYNIISYTRAWLKFLKVHHYHIVHAHATGAAFIYLRIAKRAGCITIAHSHSDGYRGNCFQRIAKQLMAKGVKEFADYWFACSEKAAIRLFGDSYKSNLRYYEIPNAINVEEYKFEELTRNRIRRKYGIADDEFVCGHVGTFSVPKNHEFLIEIFDKLLKLNPKSKLMCCGDGFLMSKVRQKALNMGLLDKIIFTGVVTNVNDYMKAMDALVFPSLFEGFGIAVLEAQASGLPIVMSDVIPETVDLTPLIHRLSLNQEVMVWAKEVNNLRILDRTCYLKGIEESDYNMKNSINKLSNLYIEMVNK